MERSKLVCTPGDNTNLKEKIQRMDIVDLCTRERANTKWKFYKLTNPTVFAALLKMYPRVVKILYYLNAPEKCEMPYLRTEHEKTIQRQSLPLQSTCMEMRDAKKKHPKFSTFSTTIVGKQIHQSSRVFTWLIFRQWRRCCNSIFFFTTLTLDGELIGELARRSIQKFEKSVKLLRYNNHICYVSYMNSFFKSFRCST